MSACATVKPQSHHQISHHRATMAKRRASSSWSTPKEKQPKLNDGDTPASSSLHPEYSKHQAKSKREREVANVTDEMIDKSPAEKYQVQQQELEQRRDEMITSLKKTKKYRAYAPEHGVYFYAEGCHTDNMGIVAGYLNCPDTTVLRERFYENEEARSILEDLYQQFEVSLSLDPLPFVAT